MKSKRYFIISVILFILFSTSLTYGLDFKGVKNSSPEEIKRIEEFLKNNESLLNDNEKQRFIEIKEKLTRYEAVTQVEIDYMRECERNIIRIKLGEAVFEEYSKLIRKRATNSEFTPPERFRLLEIEKQLRGKN